MKIGVLLEEKFNGGGGFHQALNAILYIVENSKHKVLVLSKEYENIKYLKELGIDSQLMSLDIFDKILLKIRRTELGYFLMSKISKKNPFEKILDQHGVGLVYFVGPSYHAVDCESINFIYTVWDLCHLDHPEFPEVRERKEFERRENLFTKTLRKSCLVVADSEKGKKAISYFYGVLSDKIVVQHFSPSPFIKESVIDAFILEKYKIKPGFLFYPAQFWQHKNHQLILNAIKILKEEGISQDVVFAGSDKGNCDNIKKLAKDLGLESRVHFVGFIPNQELGSFYHYSDGLVMPTFFGPTNIPPLEAYLFNKPIYYTYAEIFNEVIPDYEYIYKIDFYDPHVLVEAIKKSRKKIPEVKINEFSRIDSIDLLSKLDCVAYKIASDC